MYSGTFLIVGLAWQGPQSASVPCQDEGGDLFFLEYLTRHVCGRLPCRFFNMSTLMSAARLTDRVGGIPLHIFIPSTRLLPSSSRATGLEGQLAKRFTPARQLFDTTTLKPLLSAPLPFDTTPLKCLPFILSTLHQAYPLSISLDDNPLEGNSIEELLQRNHSQGES